MNGYENAWGLLAEEKWVTNIKVLKLRPDSCQNFDWLKVLRVFKNLKKLESFYWCWDHSQQCSMRDGMDRAKDEIMMQKSASFFDFSLKFRYFL